MKRLAQYVSYVKQRKAAIFVGAGLSVIAGCSGLREICKKLKEIESIKEELASQNVEIIQAREMIAFCKSKLKTKEDENKFKGIMRQGLTPESDKLFKEYIPFIRKIRCISPFPPLMTTNVDDCLMLSNEFDPAKIFYELTDMTIDNFQEGGIFHLHGYIEDVAHQVWDIFDYDSRYNNEFKEFLLEVFKSYSVLYLGYSLDDDEILFQMARAKRQNNSCPTHFALLPEDDLPYDLNESIWKELYNVQVIPYGPRNKFAHILGDWIDSIYGRTEVGREEMAMQMPRQ